MTLLRNANTGAILATRVDRATTFVDRAVGLLGRGSLRPDEGLWIEPCSAIHTVGMRVAIDVIFLDRVRRVVALHQVVPPFRFALACRGASCAIELGAGAIAGNDLLLGDVVELS